MCGSMVSLLRRGIFCQPQLSGENHQNQDFCYFTAVQAGLWPPPGPIFTQKLERIFAEYIKTDKNEKLNSTCHFGNPTGLKWPKLGV